jgi:hypothetical protein
MAQPKTAENYTNELMPKNASPKKNAKSAGGIKKKPAVRKPALPRHLQPDPTAVLKFKTLYATVTKQTRAAETAKSKLKKTDLLSSAVTHLDELLEMLPMNFLPNGVLFIDIDNPESDAEPPGLIIDDDNVISPPSGKNIRSIYDATIEVEARDWRYRIFKNMLTIFPTGSADYTKAEANMLAEAKQILSRLPYLENEWSYAEWQKNMIHECANTIAWHAIENVSEQSELETALEYAERAFSVTDDDARIAARDTLVRLLLKLDKPEVAYTIVAATLQRNADYADFADFKTDNAYQAWLRGETEKFTAESHQNARDEKEKQKKIKTAQQSLALHYPNHPFVKPHAAKLLAIRKRLVEKFAGQNGVSYPEKRYTPEDLDRYEKKYACALPDVFKAFLMEVGELGAPVFKWSAIVLPTTDVESMAKSSPLTKKNTYTIHEEMPSKRVWIYESDMEYFQQSGMLSESVQYMPLPDGADVLDGTLQIGNTSGQNPAYLILNGEFSGEVWTDTLQYGAEARGCFGPAKPNEFLNHLIECLSGNMDSDVLY